MAQQGDNNRTDTGRSGQQGDDRNRQPGQQEQQSGDTGGQMGGGDDNENPGNFKNDPDRAREAGRKGGEASSDQNR